MISTKSVNDFDKCVITSKFSPHARVTPLLRMYPEQVSPAGNPAHRKAHTNGRRPLTGTMGGTSSKDHFVKANNSSR